MGARALIKTGFGEQECSTSFPGGNLFDGLPPVSSCWVFFALLLVFWRPGGSGWCRAASEEVSGSQGEPRAPERWPESSGSSLNDDFQIEAFPVKFGRVLVVGG